MKIKINEYSKGMRFLTSDQGDYSPNAPDIFVQEKPNYRMPSLEPGFEDGGRVGFDNGGKSGAERMREYRLKNPRPFKVTEIVADGVKYSIPNNAMKPENAKGFIKFLNKLEKDSNLENYRKLIAKEPAPVQKVIRSYRAYLQNEKAGAFATGSGKNLKKLFDELKLPNKSKNFLSKIGTTEIKKEIQKTRTAAAGKAAKDTSMDVVNEVRDIFVNDPNNAPSLDEVAEGLEGTKKFNAASASEKIKMRTRASNGVAQFLQAVTADRKVKGFKDIAPETLGEIIQYIDDNKRGQFRFAEGLIRDYKIKLRDSKIGGDFGKQRRNIPGQKGKVIDEVFGLSATFEDAPGYTENVQFISDEANKLKRTQIDKPFAAILKAVKNGRDTVTFDKEKKIPISQAIKDFNNKSKVFSNVNKISTPQIFVGGNLDATKLVSNFDKYSLGAQKNIKQLAKEGFVLGTTRPAKPIGIFKPSGGMTLGMNRIDPKALTAFGKAGKIAKIAAKGEAFIAPVFLAGGAMYGLPFSRNINEATYGLLGDSKNEFLIKQNPDAKIFLNIMKEDEKFKNLLENYNNASPYDKLRFKDKMEAKQNEFNQKVDAFRALPKDQIIKSQQAAEKATLEYENLIKQNRENRFQYGVIPKKQLFIDIADTFKSMAPSKPVENVLGTQIPTSQMQTEFAGGGLAKEAGIRSGAALQSGPTPQGLDYLLKRGRQY